MAKVIADNDFSYALFGGGLLGFEIGAGLTARLERRRDDGGHRRSRSQDGKLVAERPILQDSQIVDVGYVERARDHHRPPQRLRRRTRPAAPPRSSTSTSSSPTGRPRRRWSRAASSAAPTSTSRTPTSWSAAAAASARRRTSSSRGARRLDGRRRRRDPRRRRRRLVPVRGPDRPDRQDGRAEALPRGRHLRRDPAQGRDAELGEHPRDQQGPERADLRVLATSAWSATCTRSCPS